MLRTVIGAAIGHARGTLSKQQWLGERLGSHSRPAARTVARGRRCKGTCRDPSRTAFPDGFAKIKPDPDHSAEENRELLLGSSERGRLLVVTFVQRGTAIRIISARLATRKELHAYQEE